MPDFGQYLKSLRNTKKLSQMKLSRELGVSQAYLSGVENGDRELSNYYFNSLEEALKLGTEELGKLRRKWASECKIIKFNTCEYEPHQCEVLSNLCDSLDRLDKKKASRLISILREGEDS